MARAEARKLLSIPEDAFLYLSLNRNTPRKRYDLLIMAFVELIVKYPTKPIYLLCICDRGNKGGYLIFEIFVRELKRRGANTDQFMSRLILTAKEMSFQDSDINVFYNAADVGVSTAEGEGFGLCNFEQMGVGVPQVVPDIGGFKEYCRADNSTLVKPKYRGYLSLAESPIGGEVEVLDPHDFCIGMEAYLNDSLLRSTHGTTAKKTVEGFEWTTVMAPLLKRLKTELEEDMD
jgi:glycosyltransferase involved in cell wall biosynthesis